MTPEAVATLNDNCFCVPVTRPDLDALIESRIGISARALQASHPHLFAETSVFVSRADVTTMQDAVSAIEKIAAHPTYKARVLGHAPETARRGTAALGAVMGYDFHISAEGPRLIEINTNAGGAFLNALLSEVRSNCCTETAAGRKAGGEMERFGDAIAAMFKREWQLEGHSGRPSTIAIIDESPADQYLYPEFLLAKAMLEERGFRVVIADPAALDFNGTALRLDGLVIDLVYNRLTDFYLEGATTDALRQAWLAGKAVVTPNPVHHALFANKANLAVLSDRDFLLGLDLDAATLAALAVIPATRMVSPKDAERLWSERKSLFFKPLSGHAGKAVYRGDKLTRTVFAEILEGSYVAQARVEPSGRNIDLDGMVSRQKMDVRLYTYGGEVLAVAARLYQGQTTNFRTPGGGFAPVIIA
jgi:hypothetical protein